MSDMAEIDRLCQEVCKRDVQIHDMREAIEGLVYQFGYWKDGEGFTTGGLSALEEAFAVLGWKEPHAAKDVECDESGCGRQVSCGTPSQDGYRRTCYGHRPKVLPE